MMKLDKKITVIIPCHNEELGVGKVIDDIPRCKLNQMGYDIQVLVVNNNSTDRTEVVALNHGATVINESQKGKGFAIKKAFSLLDLDTDVVVMIDGDNTYKAKEIPRLIEPIESGFCDVVIGSRLGGKIRKKSLKFLNRVANWGYTFLVRQFYQANVTDVLSGFFAWKRDVIDGLNQHITSQGFDLEMEMITKMVRLGYEIYSVPVTYDMREGESKLNGVPDGVAILATFGRNLFWNPNQDQEIDWFSKTRGNQLLE
jgi:dolichol-phosphate hexosyltransferase